ncbi:unnamed protein product [Adineta ricciae]|uniref:Replication protein A subunit n=1 Tax=Adineta ricciae TaxID=249248 RepID=A0A814EBT9_ADIRI|nr:unnamed protein product [Adineta ricciae]
MTSTGLTTGAIVQYKTGNTQQAATVKVTGIRLCEPSKSSEASSSIDTERYRLSISDGEETFDACILTPELNKLVKEKLLQENSIVKLEKVVHNSTSTGKSFLVLMDLIVLPEPVTTMSNSNKQASTNICPIEMITPYLNGIWKIRARCFAKSPIRPHPVCDFDFHDTSGEIRVVAFRDECTRWHPVIEIGKIYDIMGTRVKTADKRWNSLHNTYELTLTSGSIIRLVDDPVVEQSIPDILFDFVPLRDISKHANESFIDVIGVVETCSDAVPFTNRTSNKDSKRRELTIVDEHTTTSVTLWDDQAENFDEELVENHAVVAFRRVRVAIYNNKYSLSGHRNMIIKVNPDVQEAKHLKIWYNAGGRVPTTQITTSRPVAEASWKTIGQIENEKLGRQGRPDYVSVKAICMHIANDRVVYMSCPNDACARKVNKLSSGLFHCDKCQKDFKSCEWTYMLRAELADSTGTIWVSFFRQIAEQLMGNITAEQFAHAKENNNETLMQNYLTANTCREGIFRLRINEETFNDITTVKTSCVSISDVDYSEYGQRLLQIINNQF